MADVAEIWQEALPEIKQGVTGVGVWTALNNARPVVLEDEVFVIGLPIEMSELAGHLKLPMHHRLIEQVVRKVVGTQLHVRLIDGIRPEDWETAKRRDAEARRLQEQALAKARADMESRAGWETIYEQLGRMYAGLGNKSLPQNRARYAEEAIRALIEVRLRQTATDDQTERNFARCIERVAQYSEIPSAIIATRILQGAGEL